MIELRWKLIQKYVTTVESTNVVDNTAKVHLGLEQVGTIRVLQYRECLNSMEFVNELQPAIWSEWKDVPEVEE